MPQKHPNIALIEQIDPSDLAKEPNLFAPDFVWHFCNPRLPDVQGDYTGLRGLRNFFDTLGELTEGTFAVEPISATAVGDELVVTHVKDRMTWGHQLIELDAVVVWRVVDSCIAEAWDIPSVYTERSQPPQAA